jgi:endonuclease YncB( thermonuclease family)
MSMREIFCGITLFLVFLAYQTEAAETISGVPRIIDGDTIVIGVTKIRLESIDAPESDQICVDENGERWACGIAARDRLAGHVGNGPVDCTPSGLDAYGRTLAVCRIRGEDLNAWMVREGWALAFIHYSKAYLPDEGPPRRAGLVEAR